MIHCLVGFRSIAPSSGWAPRLDQSIIKLFILTGWAMQVILSTFKLPPRISIYPDQIYSNNQAYLVPYRLSEIHSLQSVDSCLALASPVLLLPLKWWCYKRHRRSQSWSEDLIVLSFMEMINEKDSLEIWPVTENCRETTEQTLNSHLNVPYKLHHF